MKLKLLAIGLLLASTVQATPNTDTVVEQCFLYGKLSGVLMEARQDGVPLSVMLETAEGDTDPSSLIAISLLIEAYNTPIYHTLEYQEEAIIKFTSANMVECLNSVGR